MLSSSKFLALVCLGLGAVLPLGAADAAKSTFQSSFTASYDAANNKIGQLLGALSEEQLNWRPSDKVSTGREVVLHVAAANYFFGSRLGAKLPEGVNPQSLAGPDVSKAELAEILKNSTAFAQAAVAAVSEADLAAEMEFFGQKASRQRFVLILVEHAHEHLGQLIAYARSNDVVPPWSK